MAPGRFMAWSIRWLPHYLALVAAVQFANLLADSFLWHEAPPGIAAGGVLTALFAGMSALMFWSRKGPLVAPVRTVS
jgi:hypothetical protein